MGTVIEVDDRQQMEQRVADESLTIAPGMTGEGSSMRYSMIFVPQMASILSNFSCLYCASLVDMNLIPHVLQAERVLESGI